MSWWQAVVCLQRILWESNCKFTLGCMGNQLCACSGGLQLCAYGMLYTGW